MRYAAGTKDVLDRFFSNKPLKKDDVIVEVRFSYIALQNIFPFGETSVDLL